MSWFNEVTGSNDYERQSWRDSYNGGKAAGDWTGNTNARLDSERDRFQGATWSGSSSQPSALELAQSYGGPGYSGGSSGSGSTGGGAGNGAVTQGDVRPGKPAGGTGAGSRLVLTAPLTGKYKDTATGGYAGLKVEPNPWFSDVQEWWEPRYGEPGEWLGGLVNIGADGVYNTQKTLGFDSDRFFADLASAPGRVWQNAHYDSERLNKNPNGTDWSPFWEVNGSARRGLGGTVYKTGGGF